MGCGPRAFGTVRGRGTRRQAEGTASGREGGETLEQLARRGWGCPIPGSVQSQAGWGFEQPGLVKDVPAHGQGLGLGDL